ncbi:MAG: DNA polymerase III subunit delta [Candidatus Caldatribacteriota bacterium]|nr:DNA polymerase III subunit delta [Candidatus Caldatribacteriota bacterium]
MTRKIYSNYSDVSSYLKKGKLHNVYLFYGKEKYLKENIIKRIKGKLFEPAYKELNCKVFYGEKTPINEIIEELEILPFIAKYKLVVIKEAEKISKISKEKIADYIKRFKSENNLSKLIIIFGDKRPDKKIVDIVSEKGIVVNFNTIDRKKIRTWIISKFKNVDKSIDPDALYYLQTMTNSNLEDLFNEIEKIDIYTQNKKVIRMEDVMSSIGVSESLNIFKILDYIGDKDVKNALDGIVRLNNSSLHYLSIFAMIHRQIKLIFKTKMLRENGLEFISIEKKLKLPHFVIHKIINQSKKYTFKEISRAYELLNIADLELKESRKNPSLILEELVVSMVG